MKSAKSASFALSLLLALPALAQSNLLFSVQPGSTVTYTLVHKFHEVQGVSKEPEGKVRVAPDGSLVLQFRAKVETFDSGNQNRDVHMKEVTEAQKFPWVEVKAAAPAGTISSAPEGTVKIPVHGKVMFHGLEQPLDAVFEATFQGPKHAIVQGNFDVSLDAFHIERPSLMFVKVDDKVRIQPKLTLVAP